MLPKFKRLKEEAVGIGCEVDHSWLSTGVPLRYYENKVNCGTVTQEEVLTASLDLL